MKARQLLHGLKDKKAGWLTLDIGDGQVSRHFNMREYDESLARDNLALLRGYCVVSALMLAVFMLVRCAVQGVSSVNIVPYFIASAAMGLIRHTLRWKKEGTSDIRWSYALTGLFSIVWYAIAIYYDALITPERPSVFCCLVFLTLALLYNSHPKDVMLSSLCAYGVMLALEHGRAPAAVFGADAFDVLAAAALGVYLNMRNTWINVAQKLSVDMYQSATKISILVAQGDLTANTFSVLQCPDYMAATFGETTEMMGENELIAQRFVLAPFQAGYREFMDLSTIAERLDGKESLSYFFQDFRGRWCQVIVTEQKRQNGRITAFIATVRDVDEEKRKEIAYQHQLSEAMQQAQRANAAKTNFLSRMTHDIRTPLNGIIGLLRINEAHGNDVELIRANRKKMMISANYLLSLINDMLEMSKLEDGEIVLAHEPIGVMELARDIGVIVAPRAADAGVTMENTNASSGIPVPYVYGSPLHLRQIFLNIYSNCIKYNRVGGRVETKFLCMHRDEKTVTYRWIIHDTGAGMSEEFLTRVFEPFSQEHVDARSVYNGTGLGMAIVKGLVDKMGGTIAVESEMGKGSTFVVTLPFGIAPAPKKEDRAEDAGKWSIRGLHLLLAEDNELNAEIAGMLLGDEGAVITRAKDGQEALELFESNPPHTFDAILMDMMMPRMDGLSATRAIRALDQSDAKSIPILAMTANAFAEDTKRCIEAGMNAHLVKPLAMDKVIATIGKYCRGNENKEKTAALVEQPQRC